MEIEDEVLSSLGEILNLTQTQKTETALDEALEVLKNSKKDEKELEVNSKNDK